VTKGDICAISGHLCRFVDLETFVPNSSENAAQNRFKEGRILQVKLIRNLIFGLLEFWGIYKEGKPKMLILNNIRNKILGRVFAVINRGTPYVNVRKYAA